MEPVGHANLAAMLLHDPGANRQAQPGGIAAAAEARFEDMFHLVQPDAAASVGEFDDYVIVTRTGTMFGSQRDSDSATRWRVTNGI
jgi:hypothetical protein